MIRRILSYALGFAVLLAFGFAGGWIADAARLPLPGSVVGMLMLAAALRLGLIPESTVRPAAELLIRNMALLFVPAGVGVMAYGGLLAREWLPIVVAGAASTVAVLLVVGWLQQRQEDADG
ncbi:MAG TPA: CidA/LrgA family protein [Longimicrobium sp.]|nr:CidA/LrgA family protein [Longimicrobium sp.]